MKRKIFDLTQPGLLEAGVVVVVQVVEADNSVSMLEQRRWLTGQRR